MNREEHYTLQLKNGGKADVKRALVLLSILRDTQESLPGLLPAVIAVAQGRSDEVNPETLEFLKGGPFLRKDGSFYPDYRDIILSAYRVVGDGPVLVSPFILATAQDRLIVERVQRQLNDFLDRPF